MSIFLFAIGAILTWAVELETSGVDLNVVGVILMIVGIVGFIASMLFWSPWAPYGRGRTVTHEHNMPDEHGTPHAH